MILRTMFCLLLTLPVALGGPVGADSAFVGPAGWSHNTPSATPNPSRLVDQWHIAGDIATVTFTKDMTTTYTDALAAIETNFSTNKIKPATDKDMPCQGKTAHVVEFTTGPDNLQTVINRLLVPNGDGIETITYFRSGGTPFDPAVKKSEMDFCTP